MKTNFYITPFFGLVLLTCGFAARGGDVSFKFGEVSREELALGEYAKDPDAGAVVLFDIGKSWFPSSDNGFDIEFTRTKRIKIFKKSAFDYAEIAIPFWQDGYGKTEIVKDIEAYTYNLESGIIKKTALNTKEVYEEKSTENWYLKKFAMPDVKEGSIIEFRYVLKTPFKYNLPDWEFQHRIPTAYSEYEVRIVPFYSYVFILQGATKFDEFESYESKGVDRQFGRHEFRDMVYKYVMKDVPAFKDESYITSINDYIVKLDFQLSKFFNYDGVSTDIITTWQNLNNDLLKRDSFGKYIKNSENIGSKIVEKELSLDGLTDEEKCQKIVAYVKDHFKWDGYVSRSANKKTKEFLDDKTGNSAEVNLFLVGMLQAAGFDAHAVLLSTRSHGKIKLDYPFEHFFNDVIVLVKIGERFVLTDATQDYSSFDRVPLRAINDKGLVVMKNAEPWVKLDQDYVSSINENLMLRLTDNKDSIEGQFTTQLTEYDALNYKNACHDKEKLIKDMLKEKGFSDINELTTLNFENSKSPYTWSFKAKVPMEKFEDKLFVPVFLNFALSDNLLKQSERSYPVDMIYKKRRVFKNVLSVPDGYSISKLPSNYTFEDDLVKLYFKASELNGLVACEGLYLFKKSVYEPQEYTRLKQHMDDIISHFNEKLVLVKLN